MRNVYYTKDVSDNLWIGQSTLRKWSLLLEKEGYKFDKNEKNQRLYRDIDLVVLRRLKDIVEENTMTLDNAVKTVAASYKEHEEAGSSVVTAEAPSPMEAKIDVLLEYIKKQDERMERLERFNKELVARLEEEKKYNAERDRELMSLIRDMQETKKFLAASIEEKEKVEEKPKGLLARLFGK